MSIDQLSKYVFLVWDQSGKFAEDIWIIPQILSIHVVHNTGIAFGIDMGRIPLLIVTSVGLALVGYLWKSDPFRQKSLVKFGYVSILSGAFSNAFDRFTFGYVVDFLSIRHFAVCNIADVAITLGVGLLILAQIRYARTK